MQETADAEAAFDAHQDSDDVVEAAAE